MIYPIIPNTTCQREYNVQIQFRLKDVANDNRQSDTVPTVADSKLQI